MSARENPMPCPATTNTGANATISASITDSTIHAKPKSSSTPVRNSGSVMRRRMMPVANTPVEMPKI